MRGEQFRIEPRRGAPLHDFHHELIGEGGAGDASMPVHIPEERAAGQDRGVQPAA